MENDYWQFKLLLAMNWNEIKKNSKFSFSDRWSKKLIMGIIHLCRVTVATAAVWDTSVLSLSGQNRLFGGPWQLAEAGRLLAPPDDYCRIADGPRQTPAERGGMWLIILQTQSPLEHHFQILSQPHWNALFLALITGIPAQVGEMPLQRPETGRL
jgi:hypothetical protein